MTTSIAIAATALVMLVLGEVVDYLEHRADRHIEADLARHDVETLPGGHLLHLSGCWCRACEPAGAPRNARYLPRQPIPVQDHVPPPPPR